MCQLIMVIRHVEKPNESAGNFGIDRLGKRDRTELCVTGRKRAGALVRFFAPSHGHTDARLAIPTALFADDVWDTRDTVRPQSTVGPLAELLQLSIDKTSHDGQEQQLVAAAVVSPGPVLICWRHDTIRDIANELLGDQSAPQHWDPTRFDLVWAFSLRSQGWKLSQVPQLLLPGDRTAPIV